MTSLRKASISCVAAVALALTGTSAQAATPKQLTKTDAAQAKSRNKTATLNVQKVNKQGYMASVENGTVKKSADGTLVVQDRNGDTAASLKKSFLVSDGSIVNVDYTVDGSTITAKYSNPIVEGKREPVVTQGIPECVLGGMTATGAGLAMAGTILSGGAGLVLAGAVVGAGAAAANGGWQCGKAAKGK